MKGLHLFIFYIHFKGFFVHFTGMSLTPELSDVASIPEDMVVQRMVALFDYDPWESSPNMDSEVSHIMTHILFCIIIYP